MLKTLKLVLFALLPSRVKVVLLRRLGHQIGEGVVIGISYIDVQALLLSDGVRIASWNFFRNLRRLEMGECARVGGKFNHFTASPNNNDGNIDFGVLRIGKGANITSRHLFDVQAGIEIGEGTIVAGSRSVFYTHTYTPFTDNVNRPIVIGGRCYIGSHVVLLPGAKIGARNFIGAGSVLSRDLSLESCSLIAGNPAQAVKRYPEDAPYWGRKLDGFLPRNL